MSKVIKTKQEQIEEIRKCAREPIYFIKNYLEIQHPVKGRLPFNLYPFQEEVINNLCDHRYNIVLKSRQLGLSTVMSAYCLWLAVFFRDKNVLLIADNFRGSKNMLAKIKVAWRALPKWMLSVLEITDLSVDSSTVLGFANGSKIQAFPTTEDTARGQAASLVVVDEAAINKKLEEGWKSIYSTTSTGGDIIVFSTPRGANGLFYELWQNAKKKENSFNTLELPWYVHPEHDEKWFEAETKNMDKKQIAQEMLCDFTTSGNTFFDSGAIEELRQGCSNPIAYDGPSESKMTDLWIWKFPESGHDYLLTADVARGDADDYSAFHVIDMTTWEQVAEFCGKIATDRYADYMVKIGYQYNTAFIVQEKNAVGIATAIKLRDLKYPFLYWEKATPEEMEYMTDEEKQDMVPGFTTKTGNQPGNRDAILAALEEIVRNKKLKFNSLRFIEQMTKFNWNGKRGQAARGNSDDLIMALAIGCFLRPPQGYSNLKTSNGELSDWHKAFLATVGKHPNNTNLNQRQAQGLSEMQRAQKQTGFPAGVNKDNVQFSRMVDRMFGWVRD